MSKNTSASASRTSQFWSEFIIPWEQAFNKFGFCDGDFSVTYRIVDFLEYEGFRVEFRQWGLHNEIITSLIKDGKQLIPGNNPDITLGYSDPREHLPEGVIQLLDEAFPC